MELYLAPTSEEAKTWYEEAKQSYFAKPEGERDAGLDTFCGTSVVGKDGTTQRLDLATRAAAYDPIRNQFRAFLLLPRSSISKTPMRMANSVGLIDAGYRGVLLGAVDFQQDFTAAAGERYFQIVGADLLPWKAIHIVDEIPGGATLRGEGGFGSTGRGYASASAGASTSAPAIFHDIPTFPTTSQQVSFDEATSTVSVHTLAPGSYFNA
jgi:dUTP pyrophosphatase